MTKGVGGKRKTRERGPSSERQRRPELRDFLYSFPFFLIDRLGKGIILVLLAYVIVYLPIRELAGKDTTFLFNLVTKVAMDKWVYLITNAVFGGAWYLERRSRQKYVKKHGEREKNLEKRIDPDRRTSGLTNSGTPPGPKGDET